MEHLARDSGQDQLFVRCKIELDLRPAAQDDDFLVKMPPLKP